MKILIFEWLLGGGQWLDGTTAVRESGMQAQGSQMLQALEQDFSALGIHVIITLDSRIAYTPQPRTLAVPIAKKTSLHQELQRIAQQVDFILLVAPETNGTLIRCCQWLCEFQHKFLSPQPSVVELCSDKSRTCRFLAEHSIPTTHGILIEPVGNVLDRYPQVTPSLLPGVLKPNCGAGGEATFFVKDMAALVELIGEQSEKASRPMRLEMWAEGTPTSTSLICGPAGYELLKSTRQVFRGWPIGTYTRNLADLSDDQLSRAGQLAYRVCESLPPTCGYLGIDMILGNKPENDLVVEINPRLTSSYTLLRTLDSRNLAQTMLTYAT